jgi:hypothetical protein
VAKEMYEYKSVQVPEEAKAIIDAEHKKAQKKGLNTRKADLWLKAVRLLTNKKDDKS